MKKGGYPQGAAGFTIAETLIVLAVSAILVGSAIITISGRTDKTQFITSVNDLKQQFQQVMNEAATGYFPNANNFTCTPAVVQAIPTLANGTQQQGTNGGCVFLGKAVQFGATDYTNQFLTYAITGNRLQAGTKTEVTSLTQAQPEAVAKGSFYNSGLTGVTVAQPLENGLSIQSMKYGGTNNTGGFALLSSLASYTQGGTGTDCNGVCSGSQTMSLYAIAGTSVNSGTSQGFVDRLDGFGQVNNSAANYISVSSIVACFNSGSTNQSVIYTLGNSGNPQAVNMKIQSGSCS